MWHGALTKGLQIAWRFPRTFQVLRVCLHGPATSESQLRGASSGGRTRATQLDRCLTTSGFQPCAWDATTQLSSVVTRGDFSIFVLFLPTEPCSIRSRMHCFRVPHVSHCLRVESTGRTCARARTCRPFPTCYGVGALWCTMLVCVSCMCARVWFGRGGRSAWDATVLAAQ